MSSRCSCCGGFNVFTDGLCYPCWSEITGVDLPNMNGNDEEDCDDIYECEIDSLGTNWW